ncbi:hypothetical protein [Nonomuraea endophytica]|uniref:WD40 repeat domain-containing protein n=1 Tax=Nonomuraea endophytica TaxID=714136 RepID=A0A7W8AEN6_9ACTN|nr:hypothetical protein [Nonomuraea endophytica]MBB5083676.1 hypothetical protein [Nonomuraea endophytica]
MDISTCLRSAAVVALAAVGCAVPAGAAGASTAGKPPALPESGAGAAAFAYLCAAGKDLLPTGKCDTWRVVTLGGRIYSFPEALAYEKGKKADDAGEAGAFAISPDGTRVAYQRASDDRVVVRDLGSGETWELPHRAPKGSVGSPFSLKFVRDGGLAITHPLYSDRPVTTYVEVESGTARNMPRDLTLLDVEPGSGRLTLLSEPGIGNRGWFHTVAGGRTTKAKIPEKAGKHLIWGAFTARNGRAANLVPKGPPACGPDMTPVWLTVYSTTTGKMTKVKPRLPVDVNRADAIDWLGTEEIVAAASRERPGKKESTVLGTYVYAVNVKSGASRLLSKLSTGESVFEGRLVVGGYTAVKSGAAAGKIAKPGKRGCG